MIYVYKWLSPDCIFTPVTDSWELVELTSLFGEPCSIMRKRKENMKRSAT